MTTPGADAPDGTAVLTRRLWLRVAAGAALLVAGGFVVGFFARAPLERLATWFVGELGGVGLFVGVLVCDALPFPPIASEPFLVLARVGGLSFVDVWAIASGASFTAGLVGYACGRVLGMRPVVLRTLQRAGVAALMQKHGPLVVAVGALTPIPYAPATWAAGALRLPLPSFVLACTSHGLRVAVVLALWGAGYGG